MSASRTLELAARFGWIVVVTCADRVKRPYRVRAVEGGYELDLAVDVLAANERGAA